MELIISNSSGKPIYEQITNQIKGLILSGELTAGEMLPSMRQLARDLHISVITTKRAYEDLERDGFLTNVPGKGCFVAQANSEVMREETLRRVQDALVQAIEIAKTGGVTAKELTELVELLYEGE